MATTLYKESSYVRWDSQGNVITSSKNIGSGGGGESFTYEKLAPMSNILHWDKTYSWYAPYTAQAEGKFDNSSSFPIGTTQLNYNGHFYANHIYGNHVYAGDGIGDYGLLSPYILGITLSSTPRMLFTPNIGDNTGVVAYYFDTNNNLTGAGSKLLWLGNQGVEKLHVDNLGYIATPDGSGNDLRLYSGNAVGVAGTNAGNLYLKAGNAISADDTSSPGNIYIAPGDGFMVNSAGTVSFGHPDSLNTIVQLDAAGVESNIDMLLRGKGTGRIYLGNYTTSKIGLYSESIKLGGFYGDVSLECEDTYAANGISLNIVAGPGSTTGGTGNYNGGNLYLRGGVPIGTGVPGEIYLGTGAAGSLSAKTDETNVVYYDSATGLLTYGAAGAGGGCALTGSTNNTVCTVTGADAIQGEANLTFDGSDLSVTGTIHSTGDMTATDFVQSSDERLKTNIEPYNPKFIDINYKQFNFKLDPEQFHCGVIAQELKKIHPELIREGANGELSVVSIDLLFMEIAYLKYKLKELEKWQQGII